MEDMLASAFVDLEERRKRLQIKRKVVIGSFRKSCACVHLKNYSTKRKNCLNDIIHVRALLGNNDVN